ncbi:hypothetical protein M405DRAFT_728213 [Rhizopogon salebrosus TDB-379]|nr:hypothetical protein M405DRAFT_728213 [Rhizopogon salebrosus TDB-379]
MVDTDMIFRFVFPSEADCDMRTFRIYQVIGGTAHEELVLYKFSHSTTGPGSSSGTTTYHRKNMTSLAFECAGYIHWSSNTNATVCFGVDELSIKDVRKVKNATSRSRRFQCSAGAWHKWKIADNGTDLYVRDCTDSKNKHIASWSHEERTLKVTPYASIMIDRVVVTCFLNVWFKRLGRW